MNSERKIIEVSLSHLRPFSLCKGQTYRGKRLAQMVDSIEHEGLIQPITVRKIKTETEEDQYEIICGHNRVEAMRKLGRETIEAEVLLDISDDEAIRKYYDSNFNQQNFSDWNYSQKIIAVKYIVKQIESNSRQGQRSDIKKNVEISEDGTSVYSRQKSDGEVPKVTTRDRMARQFGISPATLGKYRSIIKLPTETVDAMSRLLDSRRLTLEAAYRISKLKQAEAKVVVDYLDSSTEEKVTVDAIKELCKMSKGSESDLPKDKILSVLYPKSESQSKKFHPIRRQTSD